MEKIMKKTLSVVLLLLLALSVLTITSCGKKDDVPDGMQLVKGGSELGYYFYGPEEWVVANIGDIASTYASKIDTSGMTFVKTDAPDGEISEYFKTEAEKLPFEITVKVDGEDCSFGNADKLAKRYVYTYTYKDVEYTCMQIFVRNSQDFYIFTYTANNEKRGDDKTYYEFYLDKVNASIESFKFTEITAAKNEKIEYEKDLDGRILVSDKTLSGFKLYVPENYTVDFSSAIVSVSAPDGSNVTVSETTFPATTQDEYWNERRKSIEAIADKTTSPSGDTVSTFKVITPPYDIHVRGADAGVAYVYSYSLEGVEYQVFQVLMRDGTIGGSVYVLTYTATTTHYNDNINEVLDILERLEF